MQVRKGELYTPLWAVRGAVTVEVHMEGLQKLSPELWCDAALPLLDIFAEESGEHTEVPDSLDAQQCLKNRLSGARRERDAAFQP